MYIRLMNHYPWASIDAISNMSPHQQLMAIQGTYSINGDGTQTFKTMEDYLAWKAGR